MIQFETQISSGYFYNIPEGAIEFKVDNFWYFDIYKSTNVYYKLEAMPLGTISYMLGTTITRENDTYKYVLLGKLSELTEEDAKQVVTTELNGGYTNYNSVIDVSGFDSYKTALESLKSLTKSKGFEDDCLIIIKKNK